MSRTAVLAGLLLVVAALVLLPPGTAAAAGLAAMPLVAFAALGCAIAALVLASMAWRRAARTGVEMRRLAQSIDLSMREIALAQESMAMPQSETQPTEKPPDSPPRKEAPASPAPAAASARLRGADRGRPPSLLGASGVERSLAELLQRDAPLPVSLQPIVSVRRRETIGMELFAWLAGSGGDDLHIRRLAGNSGDLDPAAFEKALLLAGLDVARRHLGARSERMQCHVALSGAFLTQSGSAAWLAGMLSLHPVLARSLVLSVPFDLIAERGASRHAIDEIATVGGIFCVEGWDERVGQVDTEAAGIAWVKMPAGRLLDRLGLGGDRATGRELIQRMQGLGLTPIATEVTSDEDAGSLFELGVDAMCGPHFQDPRPMKGASQAGGQTG